MKEKIAKTNVARLLDKAKIAYELIIRSRRERPQRCSRCRQFGREHRTSLQDFGASWG